MAAATACSFARHARVAVDCRGNSNRRVRRAAANVASCIGCGGESVSPAGPPDSTKPAWVMRRLIASDIGSTTIPWPVTGSWNSAVRRSIATPWPEARWVPTSNVPPVCGSVMATTWPGALAAKSNPSSVTAAVKAAGLGFAGTIEIRQPDDMPAAAGDDMPAEAGDDMPAGAGDELAAAAGDELPAWPGADMAAGAGDNITDWPGGLVSRITVAAREMLVTAEPNAGSSCNAARSIGRRSSNTTNVSDPRENNAAPTWPGKGTWIATPLRPLGGLALNATIATGPDGVGSRVTGQIWPNSA